VLLYQTAVIAIQFLIPLNGRKVSRGEQDLPKPPRLAALAACTALFGAVLTGCGDNKATSDEIRIGANFEMTGNTANYGTSTLEGLKLAIKEANDAGGINMMNYAPEAMNSGIAAPISSGKIEVSSTVTITYALQ